MKIRPPIGRPLRPSQIRRSLAALKASKALSLAHKRLVARQITRSGAR
ncbi:MAG: hypothetical protein KGL46_14240 [Hyphomicrobiales bacterium]|nr:hypothetical protein [Hyphomicrobiales bacterium]